MASVKLEYASSVALTISLVDTSVGLANSATVGRASTAVSNATNKYLDYLVETQVKLDAGTIGNDRGVHVMVYASIDGGTNFSGGVTGIDASYTIADPTVLRYAQYIPTPSQSTTYRAAPFSVAELFGGTCPERWGVVILNYSGIDLTDTGSDHYVKAQGVYQTVV